VAEHLLRILQYVQASFKLFGSIDLPASASQAAGLKACTTVSGLMYIIER
jgi:hypothetical protein